MQTVDLHRDNRVDRRRWMDLLANLKCFARTNQRSPSHQDRFMSTSTVEVPLSDLCSFLRQGSYYSVSGMLVPGPITLPVIVEGASHSFEAQNGVESQLKSHTCTRIILANVMDNQVDPTKNLTSDRLLFVNSSECAN